MLYKSALRKGFICFLLLILIMPTLYAQKENNKPIRLAIAGMSKSHLAFVLRRPVVGDCQVVGFYDANEILTSEISRKQGIDSKLIFNALEKMLDETKPDAVVAFGSIYNHLAVVEACAPRGIHVMVEKPLAVNMKHAIRMADLAKMHNIHLLTNYETSWYPTIAKSFEMIQKEDVVGQLKRVIINDGHSGPKEIGCDAYFLEWLTDPVLNGGGAIVDFGCYGANLITALTQGEKPISVTAVTRQLKPEIYPKVDDDATIVIAYPNFQCIIQASWNWPFSRKDMEIYGEKGYIKVDNNKDMRVKRSKESTEDKMSISDADIAVYTDPFSYFFDVINNQISMKPYGLYSLENNLRVVELLDLARASAKTGETKYFE